MMKQICVPRYLVWRCLLLTSVLGLFLCMPKSVWSQGLGLRASWSSATNLSLTAETVSRYPAIASDRMGNIHVAWLEEQGDQDGTSMIYYRMWDRQRWSLPTDIILGKWLLLPSLAVDSKGVIHLVYVSGSALMYSHAEVNGQPWSSKAWSTPVTIGSNIVARWPEIHVDAQDRLYILYNADYTASIPKVALIYSGDSGVTWSEPVVISNSDVIASVEFSNVNRLAISPRGTLYAIWGEGKTEYTSTQTLRVLFSRSENGGATWSRPLLLSDNTKPGYAEALAVVVDNRERVHVLWRNRDNLIMHEWSEDGGVKWSSPQPVAATQDSQRYGGVSVVLDGLGSIYMSYVSGSRIYLSRWDGAKWYAPELVAETVVSGVSTIVWPRMAINLGNELHVVWYDGFPELAEPDLLTRLGRGEYEIRYSAKLLNLPPTQVQPFSITPRAPATVVRTLTPPAPTITSIPKTRTLIPDEGAEIPRTENTFIVPILTPLILVGLVVFISWYRRSTGR
jgi:hypothetical protein